LLDQSRLIWSFSRDRASRLDPCSWKTGINNQPTARLLDVTRFVLHNLRESLVLFWEAEGFKHGLVEAVKQCAVRYRGDAAYSG